MDTGYGLLGILCVHFIGDFAVFFGDGQDARTGERFEGVGGLGMEDTDPNGKIVARIEKSQCRDENDQDPLGEEMR